MIFEFMTREVWEFLIVANIITGLIWAGVRLYKDLTRSLPEEQAPGGSGESKEEVGATPRSSSRPDQQPET